MIRLLRRTFNDPGPWLAACILVALAAVAGMAALLAVGQNVLGLLAYVAGMCVFLALTQGWADAQHRRRFRGRTRARQRRMAEMREGYYLGSRQLARVLGYEPEYDRLHAATRSNWPDPHVVHDDPLRVEPHRPGRTT